MKLKRIFLVPICFVMIFSLCSCSVSTFIKDMIEIVSLVPFIAEEVTEEIITFPVTKKAIDRQTRYNNNMRDALTEGSGILMGSIFDDFEWDKAYIVDESTDGRARLQEVIEVEVPYGYSSQETRIYFLNNGELVYEHFYYPSEDFCLSPEGVIVYKDTIIVPDGSLETYGGTLVPKGKLMGRYFYY
ncbi:MAG: hypothetical protein IJL87_08330 [Clostridia bacterium]|nr:hypothetical protein [Clostridia bacterium]